MTGRFLFLAEDDTDDQEFLIEALRQIDPDVRVHVESAGDKALDFLLNVPQDEAPQLILLDYNLPRINGQQILTQLAQRGRLQQTTKLVWSTSSSPLYERACIEAGATEYLVKPVDITGISRIAQVVLDHFD